jgi:hypothetical protein
VILTGIFAGVAAGSNSGRKHVRSLGVGRPQRPATKKQPYRIPPPPSLPPLGQSSVAPSQSPAPPSQVPAPSYSPPAVVSGGS